MKKHSLFLIAVHFRSILMAGLALVLLAGCQSPDVAQGFSKGGVKTARIDPVVPVEGMRLGLQQYGMAALSYGIVNKMYEGRVGAIQASMDEAKINVAEWVRAEFQRQLEARGLVEMVSDNADAVFLIEIPQFGFVEYPPLTSNDVPFLELECRLLDRNENVLWKAKALQSKRGYPGMGGSLKDYTDPEKLRKDWAAQIQEAVAQLLEPK